MALHNSVCSICPESPLEHVICYLWRLPISYGGRVMQLHFVCVAPWNLARSVLLMVLLNLLAHHSEQDFFLDSCFCSAVGC